MKPVSLSRAKNLMRRALNDLVDPPPSDAQQELLRNHFEHACAYCGGTARPREGHIDHAVPGSGSALGNLLLACSTCNGDEKRAASWEEFLALKCGGEGSALFATRRARIREWFDAHAVAPRVSTDAIRSAREEAEVAIRGFEDAYVRLRTIVRARDAAARA